MMPSVPMAQRSKPPPVNILYIPTNPPAAPPALALLERNSFKAAPFRPGVGMREATRQMPSTIMVKRMRDFSSGILKQLLNVLKMDWIIFYARAAGLAPLAAG